MAAAEYHRDWYHRHRERLKPVKTARSLKTRRFVRHVLNEFKLLMGCQECGYDKHPRALEFHHRDPSTKSFDIASGATTHGLLSVLNEVDKCDVLCANCHAIHESSVGKSDSGNLRPSDG